MKRAGLICLMVLMLLASCTQGGRPSESGSGATTDVPSGGGAAGTEPRGTETGQVPEPELNGSGWCAVGSAGGGKAVILADTGAVVSLNYTGNVTPGLIHSYEYEKEAGTVKLTLASTFPEVADRDSGGNDLSVWNMGAYPSSSSVYYGAQYSLSDDTPVFVRYGNNEWRLGHGKSAFASDGLTRGYINVTGSAVNFVMIVGACGSLENMLPANASVTACMDPDGNGFDRGNISLDGSIIPDSRPEILTDEDGLTVPQGTKMTETLIYKKIGDKELRMTFLAPTKKVFDRAPVYYLITGGGWNSCDRQGMIGFSGISSEKLRQEGFAVTSIDYRIMQDGADMKAIISDCTDGLRYLSKYSEKLGIDPQRIAIAGHSAGGYLALMTAMGSPENFTSDSVLAGKYGFGIIGCAAMSPVTVCYEVNGKLLTAVTHLPKLFADENEAHAASPFDLISKDICPVLITTGTDDAAVFPENTYMFRDRAASVGADVTVIISEHAGHSYEPMNGAQTVSVPFTGIQNRVADYILGLVK